MRNHGITKIRSFFTGEEYLQKQSYITDPTYPYWLLYRNSFFDQVASKLTFNVFEVFRDRQITNSNSFKESILENSIRVLKSRNISDDGSTLLDIPGYDTYITKDTLKKLNVAQFLECDNVYLTPNMTYLPRMMKKPKGVIVNGSIAILIPKKPLSLTEEDMKYYSTKEYRNFYRIARNFQTRSLNIDSNSVFFFGIQNS